MQNDITCTQQDDFCAPKTSEDISDPEQPTHLNSRTTKSTRNRPPTARALEALVNGDLTAKTSILPQRISQTYQIIGVNGYMTAKTRRKNDACICSPRHHGLSSNVVIPEDSETGLINVGNIVTFDKLHTYISFLASTSAKAKVKMYVKNNKMVLIM
ncbi:hypothetical protein POM88_010846 [Heracleum sosnowskyi]|uniref:Uncharacterized protein n=1 Tax=Heracleum sosnowskyi TaxID=360622 RepID=A0AAD8ITY3_9APIA|nr:hypothetical protein POM88_010846 [Heracleum sosnowskyi]